jgi:hypothetical protein
VASERLPGFVLAHSPLVGPATWSLVVRELERRGRDAAVPSLLGIADAPSPQWRHLATVTDPSAVTDALLELERELLATT